LSKKNLAPTLIWGLLGALAPAGWILVKALWFGFGPMHERSWSEASGYFFGDPEGLALVLYMGLGTALATTCFGWFRSRYQGLIESKELNLKDLSRTGSQQEKQLQERIRSLSDTIKKFHASSSHLQKSLDPRQVLHLAAESLHEIHNYDRVNVMMLNPEKECLEFIASLGTAEQNVRGITLPYDDRAGVLYRAVRENRLFRVEDIQKLDKSYHLKPPCDNLPQLRSRAFIVCPIVVQGSPWGLIAFDNKRQRGALGEADEETVRLVADQISSALAKIRLLESVEHLTDELQRTFAGMVAHEEKISQVIRSLKAGTAATTDTIGSIAGSAEVVRSAVADTSSAAQKISRRMDQVSGNFDQLEISMADARKALGDISAQVEQVEGNTATSLDRAEEVRNQAREGQDLVRETCRGLNQISREVGQTRETINILQEKSSVIEKVTGVIHDINQKTNLLSLNAAIIAAQAGEQGHAFAVVAEEIRHLAQETAYSAGDIETLIQEIQLATGRVADQIEGTTKVVASELEVGERTDASLTRILSSSEGAMKIADQIRHATREQTRSTHLVSESFADLERLTHQAAEAFQEQTEGLHRIIRAVEEIKTKAAEVASATQRQEQETVRIDKEVDTVSATTAKVFTEMKQRQEASQEVLSQVDQFRKLSENKD